MTTAFHAGFVKGFNRAPYRDQVVMVLVQRGSGDRLNESEERKVARVARFLSAHDCAVEIENERNRKPKE